MKILGIRATTRHFVAAGVLAGLVLAYVLFLRDRITLDDLALWREALDRWVGNNRLLSVLTLFAIGVAATSTPLPLAGIYAVGSGFLLGGTAGLAVALPASAAGATFGMLMARYFFGPEWRGRFESIFGMIDRHGGGMVFSLRMVPVVPFFIINTVSGLTRLHWIRFLVATGTGMLPVTSLLVFAGVQISKVGQESGGSVLSVSTVAWLSVIGLTFLVGLPLAKSRLAGSKA